MRVEQAEATELVTRPRVLHLLDSFELGGTERQAIELLKRLDRRRFDVRLAVLRKEGSLLAKAAPLFPTIPEFRLGSFYDANAWRQLRRLRALLLDERIEILHTHDFYAGLLGALAAQFTSVRVIASQRHLRLSERRIHDYGRRLINRLADRVVVNAEMIRAHVLARRSADPRKLRVIRNGLLEETLPVQGTAAALAVRRELLTELQLGAEVKLIGMIANLRPVKGHRYLLEAAVAVVKQHPNAHFVLIGDGPLKAELAAQARQSGLGAHVHLLGARAGAARFNAAFDLAVLASLHEGLPNVVLEAMAAGVAVVATAVGGVRELLVEGETGFLVAPADSCALAESICFALDHNTLCAECSARARRFVLAEFDMQRMVESFEALYDELRR
jgi:glycosyltransferase involved in cell wall biosynthesis